MRNGAKLTIIIAALVTMIFAIKPHYGGEVTIRLNEPANFVFTPSDYSNLVFYSLLYENLFYLKDNGEIFSNIFRYYKYDKTGQTLVLELKKNLSFSNGDPIETKNVKLSLKLFLDMKRETSLRLGRIVKNIRTEGNRIIIELMYDNPDIISWLTTPELVLLSGTDGIFSGMFYPVEWGENRYIKLAPNKYYPGGRTYLDAVKVVFYDYYYPDIFLSKPGLIESGFREFNAGVYQNIYLSFPHGKVGTNTRIALYSLLREFAKSIEATPLNVLTSDEESPVTLNIKSFSGWKIRSILRRSRITLYILSSLKEIEERLAEFLTGKRLRLETIYLSDNELNHFMNSIRINYLIMVKVFNKRMPIDEKIKKIIREMSFTRFNETYLKLLNQLDEIKFLKNEELLIDQVSKLIEKIVKDGFLLPLYQNRYSLYIKKQVKGVEMDYYGRPLFHRMRLEPDRGVQERRIKKSAEKDAEPKRDNTLIR